MHCVECDGQGIIQKWKLTPTGEILFVCDECEATYTREEGINKGNFVRLPNYLEEKGYDIKNAPIEKIEEATR